MVEDMVEVAYLGPRGTFTQTAMERLIELGQIPADATGQPVNSPAEVAAAVASGRARYGVVAIENSLDGAVTATFDALIENPGARIVAEVDVPIEFALLVRAGVGKPIETFATHPVARQQVRHAVAQYASNAAFVPASSNAAAAEMVADGEVDAAFAPRVAADLYGLEVVEDKLIDDPSATTRFVLLRPENAGDFPAPTGNDRTSVSVCLPNHPGSLVEALHVFADNDLDLSRIESRPTRTGLGTYRFHIDFSGHIDDPVSQRVLQRLEQMCAPVGDIPGFAFLGSWPVGDIPGPDACQQLG